MGESKCFMASSEPDFLGTFVLYFRKCVLYIAYKQNLSKKYGFVLILKWSRGVNSPQGASNGQTFVALVMNKFGIPFHGQEYFEQSIFMVRDFAVFLFCLAILVYCIFIQ